MKKTLLIIPIILLLFGCNQTKEEIAMLKKVEKLETDLQFEHFRKNEAVRIAGLLEQDDLCWRDFNGVITKNKETRCPQAYTTRATDKVWCFEPESCSYFLDN